MRFVAIDLETGDSSGSQILAVALVPVEDGHIGLGWSSLVRVSSSHIKHSSLHGIRQQDLLTAPPFPTVWKELESRWSGVDFLVAHNAGFERRALRLAADRHGLDMRLPPFRCTLKEARRRWPGRRCDLPAVCERLNIPLKHHDPSSDARAAAKIALALRIGR